MMHKFVTLLSDAQPPQLLLPLSSATAIHSVRPDVEPKVFVLVWRLEQDNAAIAYSLQKEPFAPPTSSVVTRAVTAHARRMGGVRRTQHLILRAFANPLDVLMKRQ